MHFEKKYPLPLNDVLLAPVVFRENLPGLSKAPAARTSVMRDLALFAGHSDGAIRTALSRLRSSNIVEEHGETWRLTAMGKSISSAVRARAVRSSVLRLAVFSFEASDARERKLVREGLRLHGFQKLAQNVYVNGDVETAALERSFVAEGVAENVFFFRAQADDPSLIRRLSKVFDLGARAKLLRAFGDDLRAWLTDKKLSDQDFARRLLYAGPVHYRVTFGEEPSVPEMMRPPGYPLDEVIALLPEIAARRLRAVQDYFLP